MSKKRTNIIVAGMLKSGSSAFIDMLREYQCISVISEEFDEYRAPGMISDQITYKEDDLPNKIPELTKIRNKIFIIREGLRVNRKGDFKARFDCSIKKLIRYRLVDELDKKINQIDSVDGRIEYAKVWIGKIGDMYAGNKKYVLFDQCVSPDNEIKVWREIFNPFKMIVVYRDPKDQLADIINFNYLYEVYGGPTMTMSGFTLETIYGRTRSGAIESQICALKKRYDWISRLKMELSEKELLFVNFNSLINKYAQVKRNVESFIGDIRGEQSYYKKYFNPEKAIRSIDIYKDILKPDELGKLSELESAYQELALESGMVFQV